MNYFNRNQIFLFAVVIPVVCLIAAASGNWYLTVVNAVTAGITVGYILKTSSEEEIE